MASKILSHAPAFLAPARSGDTRSRDKALPRRGRLLRMFDAVVTARQRQAERYVAEYMARNGRAHAAVQDELRGRPGSAASGADR